MSTFDDIYRQAINNPLPRGAAVVATSANPRGPADKVMDALTALGTATDEARKAGWDIEFELVDGHLNAMAFKRLTVKASP